jgi:hypothetical protein
MFAATDRAQTLYDGNALGLMIRMGELSDLNFLRQGHR